MRHVAWFLFVFLLVVGSSFSGLAADKKIIPGSYEFSPQKIELRDDAYHGGELFPFTEWWYFDAMFDNNYSAQMSVRIISALGKGSVFVRLDIYKDGSLISHDSLSYNLKEIFASSEIPSVKVHGKTILAGSYINSTGNYVYNVSIDFQRNAAVLHFVGVTKGWKGRHQSGDWWAVILPRADVTGALTVDNTTMSVNGTGYHDHNWGVNARTILNFGWFWGRFNSDDYTAIWSAILTTRATLRPMMVVNIKNAGYMTIPSETIWFKTKDIHLNHLMRIPYFINIETMTDKVFLVVNMVVVQVDHERIMGCMNYWRYHMRCSGGFMVGGHAETVDGTFIAEYIRFR